MSIVTIKINNKNFDLYCPEANKIALLNLTEKLNNEIESMKQANPGASFELLLVMTALKLQDDKMSSIEQNGAGILEDANKEFQNLLGDVSVELKHVLNKINS